MGDSLYSSHIFMFPFRFDWNENGFERKFEFYKSDGNEIEKRIQLQELHNLLDDNGWKYEEFPLKSQEAIDDKHLMYSEYSYFYDYARDSIYNLGDFSKDAISNFYRRDDFDGKAFELNIKQKGKEPYITKASTYQLKISGITLRVFHTGIAILSIELDNHNEKLEFSDILRINDYGRRVYPQFIGKDSINNTKETFLADSIKIGDIEEKFEYRDFSDTQIGNHIMQLLGEQIFTQNRKTENRFYIQPSLDDRMFVLSWCGHNDISKKLSHCYNYQNSDDWYRYIFIDTNSVTVQNNQMREKLLTDATYERWSKYNTLFGISRYSFVCLSENSDFTRNTLPLPHMKTMYFQMATLLLAIRTSILRFSDEIAALASGETLDTKKLTKLYQRYLTFYNRLYFKELTHQDQGIELYNIARKQMSIDEHIEKLDKKFGKLFEFAKIQSDDKNNEKMDKLTYLGAVFLPPSLMVAILSLGIFNYDNIDNVQWWVFGAIGFSVGIGVISIFKTFHTKPMAWLYGVLFSIIVLLSFFNIKANHIDQPKKVQIVQCVYKTDKAICQGAKNVLK